MARFRRLEVLLKIEETGIVPIFYEANAETAKKIMAACAEAGAPVIEMTNRGDHAPDVFRELEKFCRADFPDVILGVGSVVDAPTAALYLAAGANFIVAPLFDRETALLCNKRKIPYLPGCATVTEIHEAEALGVEICKLFPGDTIGGPAFVTAIKGPCPWTSVMVTGGVEPTRASLGAWFQAGITAVGIGSKLIGKDLVKAGDFSTLTKKIRETIGLVREIRQSLKR